MLQDQCVKQRPHLQEKMGLSIGMVRSSPCWEAGLGPVLVALFSG